MTGNDVVDIVYAQKQNDWKRAGFLKKVFTGKEQSYITNSENPDVIVWLLWSMKESAYKICVRQLQKIFFSPLKFECRLLGSGSNNYSGEVYFAKLVYTTFSELYYNSIFTVARDKSMEKKEIIHKKIKLSGCYYQVQHKEVYKSIIKNISRLRNKPMEQFLIKKNLLGIPEIFYNGNKTDDILSISHHGHYGSYVIADNL